MLFYTSKALAYFFINECIFVLLVFKQLAYPWGHKSIM